METRSRTFHPNANIDDADANAFLGNEPRLVRPWRLLPHGADHQGVVVRQAVNAFQRITGLVKHPPAVLECRV